jgi:outer membrane receptor protein involved in Fe transport
LHNLNLRAAYRYLDIMTTYTDGLREKPLVPKHRAFLNVDYTTRNKWKFDYTVQWVSEQRTPGIDHRHTGITPGGPNTAPSYVVMNAQITKVLSAAFDVYLGCDNITNYMQHDAIINPTNPYSPNFDASMIWGPMMGRNIFAGARYKIK